ncbi:hypothetical protein PSAB_11845 [Paenibacillus sabinae T27]|uniref:Uncharacterized protein n=1 Tax=Paenibacillus sabinae T27 TaxID=1268072 RepID=X4ZKS9_9BACL|nr:hypothetical protein PSAB_11845 [Paenibacillus sabinae T27]
MRRAKVAGLYKKIGPRLATRPFMGEEKPDEELMGKRKLAPRLSSTFCDVDNYRMTPDNRFYTSDPKFYPPP